MVRVRNLDATGIRAGPGNTPCALMAAATLAPPSLTAEGARVNHETAFFLRSPSFDHPSSPSLAAKIAFI